MNKLKAIETFVAVATRGSLTAAAQAEGVASAVVGRRLDALEDQLGVKLFVRSTRKITLTQEGAGFLEDCQRLLADLANIESNVSAGGLKPRGHLRVTAPAGFGRRHVAPLIPQFRKQYPDVKVSLNLSDRVIDIVAEGFDCAVRVGDLPDSSLVSLRLADNRRMCVASPDYVRHRGLPRTPEDLMSHDCLVLSSDASQTRGWAFKRGGVAGAEVFHLKPEGPMDCTDGQVLHDWCLGGHGIAWRSAWEVQADIDARRLVVLLEDYKAPPNGIYALYSQRQYLPLRVRLWVDFLKNCYGQASYWTG